MTGKRGTPAERFERYTIPEPNSGCVLWFGNVTQKGYGQLNLDAAGNKVLAHRFAWERANGPVPPGLFVCHKCDVPACVNPAHLFVGTAAENSRDRDRKGRATPQHGERNHFAKLTDKLAAEIFAASGSQRDIARRFAVTQPDVCNIKRRKTWTHIHAGIVR